MVTMTIRNVDDETRQVLRLRAAKHGVSVEQEVRNILKDVTRASEDTAPTGRPGENWYKSIRDLVEPHGGFELAIPPRSKAMRDPPTFE
jgi:antitoxin FitA